MRSTNYADEMARADVGGARIERLKIKSTGQEEIRFSWWKLGKFQTRPLDLTEEELLELMREAVKEHVFTTDFIRQLGKLLSDTDKNLLPEHSMVALSSGFKLNDGRSLPAGARGAIVGIWADGEAYEVEFLEPFHAVATIPAPELTQAA